MAVTASEGEKFVEDEGGVVEKRGGRDAEEEPEEEEEQEEEQEESKKLKRGRTMAVTATEGKKFVTRKPKSKSPRKSARKQKK